MYIDFKRKRGAYNPFYNRNISSLGYDLTQISKYQYSIRFPDAKLNEVKRLLKKNKYLILHEYPDEMSRSNNYRAIFFRTHPKPENGYRCLYCNKRIPDHKIEVDHIFPVRRAKTKYGQRFLKRHGINSVNDSRNLAAACHKCNRKKGSKGGMWLLRAMLGKYKWYWIVRRVLFVSFILILLDVLAFFICNTWTLLLVFIKNNIIFI